MVYIYYRFSDSTQYNDLHREAYTLLRDAMQRTYGICVDAYELCKTDLGKPYYKDCPYHFSITHTDGLVIVALSSHEVGVDAEPIDRILKHGIGKRFLHNEAADIWDWIRYESIGKLFALGIPFSKEEISQPFVTQYYTDISGYAVCCACKKKAFSAQFLPI